jgi:hypothetical protein
MRCPLLNNFRIIAKSVPVELRISQKIRNVNRAVLKYRAPKDRAMIWLC